MLNTFTILVWDLKRNVELVTFEVKAPYVIKFDNLGFFYVVTRNGVIFTKMNCKLTAFDYDINDLEDIYQRNMAATSNLKRGMSVGIDGNQGCTFDGKNHNWMQFEDYVSLPFSYLTFLMRDKLDNKKDECHIKKFAFEVDPYNYIFNKSSSFMDGNLCTQDHIRLRMVLDNFSRYDKNHLEILDYMTLTPKPVTPEDRIEKELDDEIDELEIPNSALHIAVSRNNTPIVDVLLTYMAQITTNATANFQDIFKLLPDYDQFIVYLKN